MDKETLLRIAELSKLRIEESQIESTLLDFNKIMGYVDMINELNTDSVKEDEIYFFHENRTRADKPESIIERESIAGFAPKFENGYIVVPRVIES